MIVIDASVWVSSMMPPDRQFKISLEYLSQLQLNEQTLLGPAILVVEVAGAIARIADDKRFGSLAARRLRQTPGLRLISIDIERAFQAAEHASNLRLRGADATYVSLAYEFACPLVTWDREQLSRGSAVIQTYTPLTAPSQP